MAGQRKRYSADFKVKVALEAIRGELTIAQLVAKHGVHQTLIHGWKKQALDGMDNVFIERLWWSLKYECVHIHAFETGSETRAGTGRSKIGGMTNT
jgi:hypothetical protein